jgi:hypothetical protein
MNGEDPEMNDHLTDVLNRISDEYRNDIQRDSIHYREIDLGEKAGRLGYDELKGRFENVYAILPLKEPAAGMKVLIDGRTFVDYAQFESGVVVPGYVARAAGVPFAPYAAGESMILNFT